MVEAKPAVTWQCPSEDGSMVLKNSTNDLKISSATSGFWDCHVIKTIPNRILQVARSPCFFPGGKNQLLVVSKKLLSGRVRRKKMHAGARKGRKVAIHSVFPMACGSGGSKSRLAKAAGAEPCGQMRLWREAHFEVKMYKTHHSRTTFGNWDVQKVHAVVARSTFGSQNAKLFSVSPLLEVEMSKKCTPLWREAHFQVKMYKTHHVRTTFGSWDVEKVHAVVARSTFPSQIRLCGAKHISKSKVLTN